MDRIIFEANEIVERRFRFNNPWDMECCDKPYSLINNHAYFSPNSDPEWCYTFSRLEFLRKLILAYNKTQDIKYIESYIREVCHFFSENNLKNGRLKGSPTSFYLKLFIRAKTLLINKVFKKKERCATYRTLDAAIRNYTLLCDLINCDTLNNNKEYKDFLIKRICLDMPFTIADISDFDMYSNWGLIRLSLYVCCKLLMDDRNVQAFINQIKDLLERQIRKDGGHIECSLMYHMQVLICLLRLINQMHLHNLYDEQIERTAKSMVLYAFNIAESNNNQIMYGDSDLTNIDTVMAISNSIFSTDYRLHISTPKDELLLYEFQNLDIDNSKPLLKKISYEFLDGIFIINEPQYQIRLFNETTNSNHKHADNGSVVLFYKNLPVLVDTGRYSYYDEEKRKYFKGPYGHNVFFVDDGVEWNYKNIWRFNEHPVIVENKKIKSTAFVSYKFIDKNATYRRVLFSNSNTVVLVSSVKCKGHHRLTSVWNLSDIVQCQIFDDTFHLKINDDTLKMKVFPLDSLTTQKGKISYHYNECLDAGIQLITESFFEDEGFSVAVISTENYKISENDEFFSIVFDSLPTININKEIGEITC